MKCLGNGVRALWEGWNSWLLQCGSRIRRGAGMERTDRALPQPPAAGLCPCFLVDKPFPWVSALICKKISYKATGTWDESRENLWGGCASPAFFHVTINWERGRRKHLTGQFAPAVCWPWIWPEFEGGHSERHLGDICDCSRGI